MNEKTKNKLFENIGDAFSGNINAICEFVLTLFEKPTGNLKDYLNKYDFTQLELIFAMYNGDNKDSFTQMSKEKQVTFLEKKIMDTVKNGLSQLTIGGLTELEELMKNPNYHLQNKTLLGLGLVFRSVEDDEEKYYIPVETKKEIQKSLSKSTIIDAEKNDVNLFLFAAHSIYGLVSKKLIIDTYKGKNPQSDNIKKIFKLLSDNYSTIKINNEEYFWPRTYPIIEEAKTYLDNQLKLSYEEIMAYFLNLTLFLNDIANIISKPTENQIDNLLSKIAVKERKISEIINDFSNSFSLKRYQVDELYDAFARMPEIRYWSLGGKTLEEDLADHFILETKPTNETLKSCLKVLNDEAKDILCQIYDSNNQKNLKEKIIQGLIEENLSSEDKQLILNEQKKEYKNIVLGPYDIVHGYAYPYKENGITKILVPKEIEEILLTENQNEMDAGDLIEAYMILNGIIRKEELQKLLKNNHGQDISIRELDHEILKDNHFIIDEYYSVMNDLSEFEKEIILTPKAGKEYKIVDEGTSKTLDLVDDLYEEIESYLENIKMNEISKKEFAGTALMLLHTGIYSPEALKDLMAENDFYLDKTIFRKIIECINKYKNDIPLWTYNGFTKKELNSRPKKNKIGRNDPCPCGSGKKYKKCCGK